MPFSPPRWLTRQLPVLPQQMNPQADGLEVPRGLGPQPFKPSQPRGAGPERRIVLPGCDFPPADAVPVDVFGEADIGNGGTTTILSVVVPNTLTLRIAGIGFGADDESALRFITWQLRATPPSGTITPYINMPASIGSIAQLSWVFVVIGSSVTIDLIVSNVAFVTVTYHYAARLQGWFYSEKEVA